MGIIIRNATTDDLDGISRCAEAFFEYAEFKKNGMPTDINSFRRSVSNFINDDNGIVLCLVNEDDIVVGGISGMVAPWPFNFRLRMCFEFYWWIDHQYRGGTNAFRMLRAFERESKKLGAKHVVMIGISNDRFKGMERLYSKMGYSHLETLFSKEI